jgi:hypothetical protein
MTVAEVRKALALMRKRWDSIVEKSKESQPLTADLDLGTKKLTTENFALRFILGLHTRRPNPSTPSPSSSTSSGYGAPPEARAT